MRSLRPNTHCRSFLLSPYTQERPIKRLSVMFMMVMLVLAAPYLAPGQPQTAPPKRGPEVLRLGSLIGTWKTDYGEKVTYEWFDGGFSVIGHVENSGPEGKSTE